MTTARERTYTEIIRYRREQKICTDFDHETLRLDFLARAHNDLAQARLNLDSIRFYATDRGLHWSRSVVLRHAVEGLIADVKNVTQTRFQGDYIDSLCKQAADVLRRVNMLAVNVELGDPQDAWGGNEEEEEALANRGGNAR